MVINQNSPLVTEDESRSQGFRNSHQSLLPHPVLIDLSLSEGRSPLLLKVNPQIPSLDDEDFQLPSCEMFEEDMHAGRVQVLVSLLQFDIDDATAHIDRVSSCANEPMQFSELRRRLADMNRLSEEISATFSELMNMRITFEESQMIHQLFEQHTIEYWSAKRRYESLIQESRGMKTHYRIDFRDYHSGKIPQKFTESLCSADIALLPISLEHSEPRATVTTPKLVHRGVKNVSISRLTGSQTKLSHQPQLSSPSSTSSILMKVSQQSRQGSANESSSMTSFRTPSSNPLAIVSPELAQIQTISTELVQQSANTSPEAARFHSHATQFSPQLTNNGTVDFQLRSDNASLTTGLKEPALIQPASSVLNCFAASLMCQVSNKSISGSTDLSTKSSSPPQMPSPSVSPPSTISHSVNPEFVSTPLQLSSESSMMSGNPLTMFHPPKLQPHNEQGSANASSSQTRFRTPSLNHLAIASPKESRIRMVSKQSVQQSAKVSPAAAQIHLYTSTPLFDNQVSTTQKGSANACLSMARFPTSSSIHFANASPTVSRFRMISSRLVQRPANMSSAATLFHLYDSTSLITQQVSTTQKGSANACLSMARFPTSSSIHFANASPTVSRFRMISSRLVQRPANMSSAATLFHLYDSTSLSKHQVSNIKQGSANACLSKSRFPTFSTEHSANASSTVSRFRMFSCQSVQRPANASLEVSPFHLQFSSLDQRTSNSSFESRSLLSSPSLLLCQPRSSNLSANFNVAELQIVFVPDKVVMSKISNFVIEANNRPQKFVYERQKIKRKKTSQNEAGELGFDFIANKIRDLESNHDKDIQRFCQEKKRSENAAYDNVIATGPMKAISAHSSNIRSILRLAVPFLLATNTQLFVACKFAIHSLEAACRTHRQFLQNIQFYFKKLFDFLEKFSSKNGTKIVIKAVKYFCASWNFVTWLFHFVTSAFSNKTGLTSQTSSVLDQNCFETFTANHHVKRTKNVQASSLVSKFCVLPLEQQMIAYQERIAKISMFRLVFSITKAFRSIIFVISWIDSMLAFFFTPGKLSNQFISVKTSYSFDEESERYNHRPTSHAHLHVDCEFSKKLKKVIANRLNFIQSLLSKITSIVPSQTRIKKLASSISPFVS